MIVTVASIYGAPAVSQAGRQGLCHSCSIPSAQQDQDGGLSTVVVPVGKLSHKETNRGPQGPPSPSREGKGLRMLSV